MPLEWIVYQKKMQFTYFSTSENPFETIPQYYTLSFTEPAGVAIMDF